MGLGNRNTTVQSAPKHAGWLAKYIVPLLHPTSWSSLTAFSSVVVPQLSRYFYYMQLVPPPPRPFTLALQSPRIAAVVNLETTYNINEKKK